MLRRILRVLTLDPGVFEEIGADNEATLQTFAIVTVLALLAAVSGAVRAALFALGFGALNALIGFAEEHAGDFVPFALPIFSPVAAFFSGFFGMYVTWLLWALLTWLLGVYLFKGSANFAQMVRIVGYSLAPRAIGALGFIPAIGWVAGLAGWVWASAAAFAGIRQGLGLSAGKTLLAMILSLIAVFLVNVIVLNVIFARVF